MEVVVQTPVKSSPTNQHPSFHRPDARPVVQPTVLKHWMENKLVIHKWKVAIVIVVLTVVFLDCASSGHRPELFTCSLTQSIQVFLRQPSVMFHQPPSSHSIFHTISIMLIFNTFKQTILITKLYTHNLSDIPHQVLRTRPIKLMCTGINLNIN